MIRMKIQPIKMPEETRQKLRQLARWWGVPMSEVIRELINEQWKDAQNNTDWANEESEQK